MRSNRALALGLALLASLAGSAAAQPVIWNPGLSTAGGTLSGPLTTNGIKFNSNVNSTAGLQANNSLTSLSSADSCQKSWVCIEKNWNGTLTIDGNSLVSPFKYVITDGMSATGTQGIGLRDVLSTGWTGIHNGISSNCIVNAAPASLGANYCVGVLGLGTCKSNMLGTDDAVYADYSGECFGGNFNAFTTSGATGLLYVEGAEVDVAVVTGSSTAEKHGMVFALGSNDANRAIFPDADSAINFAAQAGASATWNTLFAVGDYAHKSGLGTDSTILRLITPSTGPDSGAVPPFLHGIDLSGGSCQSGGDAFKSTGFTVDCGGAINKVTLTAPATGSTLTILNGKTFTVNKTLTLDGTDGSTLNVGAGGTLGSNAFTSTAYAPVASPTFSGTVTGPDAGTWTSSGISAAALAVNSNPVGYIVAAGGPVAVPSDTGEDILAEVTVPAPGVNGCIIVYTLWDFTGSTNSKTMKVRLTGTSGVSGTLYYNVATAVAANVSNNTTTTICNQGSASVQVAAPTNAPTGLSTSALQTSAINTAASPHIVITGTKASSGETLTLEAYSVRVQPHA